MPNSEAQPCSTNLSQALNCSYRSAIFVRLICSGVIQLFFYVSSVYDGLKKNPCSVYSSDYHSEPKTPYSCFRPCTEILLAQALLLAQDESYQYVIAVFILHGTISILPPPFNPSPEDAIHINQLKIIAQILILCSFAPLSKKFLTTRKILFKSGMALATIAMLINIYSQPKPYTENSTEKVPACMGALGAYCSLIAVTIGNWATVYSTSYMTFIPPKQLYSIWATAPTAATAATAADYQPPLHVPFQLV